MTMDATSAEVWIETPEAHAIWLHGGGRGSVTLATKRPNGEWWQAGFSLAKLRGGVRMLADQNSYLSQNRFAGTRAADRLIALQANYVDVDYYKVERLKDLPVEIVVQWALMMLAENRKPRPTLVVASGQGFYLLWKYPPVSAEATPRWRACQEELVRILAPLGADPACKDTSRVLRLIGSVHGTSGAVVRQLLPMGPIWTFDLFADELLPLTRAEIHDLQTKRAEQQAQSKVRPKPTSQRKFTLQSGYEAKYKDICRIIEVKHGGFLPAGDRYRWILAAAVCMAWIYDPFTLEREIAQFAAKYAGWSQVRTLRTVSSIVRQARLAYEGKKRVWRGRERDPRIAYSLRKLTRDLDVTPDLQEGNLALIGAEERQKRKNATERRRKASRGETKVDRGTYLANAKSRTKPWESLNTSRSTYYRILKQCKISESQGSPTA